MKYILTAFLLFFALPAHAGEVFDRVMESGKIRCAYATWPPLMDQDVNSGVLKGTSYDLMNAIGEKLDLEVEWTEEVNWGNIIEGLVTKRYDMFCTGLGQNAPRSKRMDWTDPFLYVALYGIVRQDETRFSSSKDFNSKDISISVLEGEASAITARQNFPEAQFVAIPQLAEFPQVLQDVVLKKVDVTVVEKPSFVSFEKNNPGKLKILEPKNPISVLPIALGLPQGDMEFKVMMNTTLGEVMNDGTFEKLLDKHPETRDVFLMTSKPYEVE